MATVTDYKPHPVNSLIRQSAPIDFSKPYDPSVVKGKTILITGGASGFGAGFARKWASYGANIIIGDISDAAAKKLVTEIRNTTKNQNVHSVRCDVTDWQSQVNFFKQSIKLSPHGGIDMVVANAGIAAPDDFEMPANLDQPDPPKPNLATMNVNMTGVLYTTHLAIYYLERNPESKPSDTSSDPAAKARDRHLLLIGSMASLGPIPGQPLYAASKHGVLGLFRTLRSTSFMHGIRVNIVCPYFIDTPILPAPARALLAGGALGKPEDVIEGATRLAADTRIAGRSLYIGPRLDAVQDENGEWNLKLKPAEDTDGQKLAIWEAYAHDYDDCELFSRKIISLINQVTIIRGWGGWFVDICKSVVYGIQGGKRAIFGNVQKKSKES